MPKNLGVMFILQGYRKNEALSSEVRLLSNFFSRSGNFLKIKINSIDPRLTLKLRLSRKLWDYGIIYYPLIYFFLKNELKDYNIIHLYSSLGDRLYLPFFDKKKMILTVAATSNLEKVKKRLKHLKKIKKIVVETFWQKEMLVDLGVEKGKVEIIYPGLDLSRFSYAPAQGDFKILFATSPPSKDYIKARGLYLMAEAARKDPDSKFLWLWRKNCYAQAKNISRKQNNIFVLRKSVSDTNLIYKGVHCTIIPFTCRDNYVKSVPHTLVESLAAGKPVLVSKLLEISRLVEEEKCGVAFEPTPKSLTLAIEKMKKNYRIYQKNTRRTAEKYFNLAKAAEAYEHLYNDF